MYLLESLHSALSWMGWYVLPFIVLMSVIVFVHELGHYFAGRFLQHLLTLFSSPPWLTA